jgi:CheY-like chemotaxis protein
LLWSFGVMPEPYPPLDGPLRVLIVDDEPLFVSALRRRLKAFDLLVTTCTPNALVDCAVALQPDVVLLDLYQERDGRDLLNALKSDPRTRDVRVLVASAVDDDFNRQTCIRLGAVDFLEKPFDEGSLLIIARQARCGRDERSAGPAERALH